MPTPAIHAGVFVFLKYGKPALKERCMAAQASLKLCFNGVFIEVKLSNAAYTELIPTLGIGFSNLGLTTSRHP